MGSTQAATAKDKVQAVNEKAKQKTQQRQNQQASSAEDNSGF